MGVTHLSKDVVNLLDAMLAIDPARRVDTVLQHPWISPAKKELDEAAQYGDQGSYNAQDELLIDAPAWRGSMVMGPAVDCSDMMSDDEAEPVYRSLGLMDAAEVPLPGLQRQAAFSRREAPA